MALFETVFAALLFVASAGTFFSRRFRNNRLLVAAVGVVAVISTFALVAELTKSPKSAQIREADAAIKSDPVVQRNPNGDAKFVKQPEKTSDAAVEIDPAVVESILLERYKGYFGATCEITGDGSANSTYVRGSCSNLELDSSVPNVPGCVVERVDWTNADPFGLKNCVVRYPNGTSNLGPHFSGTCYLMSDGRGGLVCGK